MSVNYEFIAILFTTIGTGIGVTGFIAPRLSKLDEHITELCERMARLEGLFEGFTARSDT